MNLLDLKTKVDFTVEYLKKHENPEDIPVLITLSENSIGARASANVSYAGMGFDWESGQFRIEPECKLVKLGNSLQDVKSVIQREFSGRKYYVCSRCGSRISKNDKFCRECGQKLR